MDGKDENLFLNSYNANVGETGNWKLSNGTGLSPGKAPDGLDNRFGWRGYWYDKATQLYHVRHRVYDPREGRWMQNDPLGFDAGDQDLYRYCEGNYSTGYDPTGLINVFGLEINPFDAEGWREVGDLFSGRNAESDSRWEANIARSTAACFKAARDLRERGESQRASELECVCRNNQTANYNAVQQVAGIRQDEWRQVGDTARNAIVSTVGVFVAPATLLGQLAFNILGNVGLEALYGGDLRQAAIDGAIDGGLGWGIGRVFGALGQRLLSRGVSEGLEASGRRLRLGAEGIPPFESGIRLPAALNADEIATATRAYNREFALVREADGSHRLFWGSPDQVLIGTPARGRSLIMHSHPSGNLLPSQADINWLRRNNQLRSVIVGPDGSTRTFWRWSRGH